MENIIIVGAGPAGISAALYAARGNMDPLIINTGIGSLEKAEKIENYYGLERPLSGKELFERGLEQARALGVRILDAQVVFFPLIQILSFIAIGTPASGPV